MNLTCRRGNPFRYTFTLSDGWTGDMFTGGFTFVVRTGGQRPSSATTSDADAMHVSTVANGEVTFSGAAGTISIPSSVTNLWEPGVYVCAAQGVVAGAVPDVFEMDPVMLSVSIDYVRGT